MKYYIIEDKSKQDLKRQESIIKDILPDAEIAVSTKRKKIKPGDTLIYKDFGKFIELNDDPKSLWHNLKEDKIEVEFLKTPAFNFNRIIEKSKTLGISADSLFELCMESYIMDADAEKNYRIASHGLSRKQGVQYGRVSGKNYTFKIEKKAKEIIRKRSRTFGGDLDDEECIKAVGCSRNSFYKYKRQLKDEIENGNH